MSAKERRRKRAKRGRGRVSGERGVLVEGKGGREHSERERRSNREPRGRSANETPDW